MKKIIILSLLLPQLVFGQKEMEVIAKITDVTVYTSAAEINCEKEISVPKGKSVIVFTDLTPFIVENSINVSASGVNIITVSERINYIKTKRNNSELVAKYNDSIIKLRKELGLITCKQDVAESEKALLFKGEAIGGLSSHGVAVVEIEKASAFFNKRYSELTMQLYELNEREENIKARLLRFNNHIKELETVLSQNTSEIKVMVNCKEEKTVKFHFKYLTAKAGWAPLYDFKYDGATQPLQFIFRANVFNASGTPWQEVNIKLSTANPIQGFSVPSLDEVPDKEKPQGEVKFKQIEVVNAITEYKIKDQYSIPSDSKPYLIDVNAYSMPANYNYLLIPKVDPFGFLIAKIPNWNKYNLIPGTSNIYNSGTFMGKTFLDTYADDDTLSLYLGKDKNIQSNRSEKTILHKHYMLGNSTLEETFIDISVKNASDDILKVEIIDQVPVFDKDDKEKLTVYNINNALYDKEEGLLTWNYNLKPGETTALNFKYEIKTPRTTYHHRYSTKRKFRTIACPSF
ncbi:MAG TPA: DUF4139 domain-containing protein [Bacteroidia bacterium]|jgi:hypothetical protein|nr:DUF4139 domain-containing protein [Bacteroidia bacterium]